MPLNSLNWFFDPAETIPYQSIASPHLSAADGVLLVVWLDRLRQQ
jgi:hypothetical protein